MVHMLRVKLRHPHVLDQPRDLKDIFAKFKKVLTVEINYSDNPDHPNITEESRRYAQLAWLLRARTLVDVDCFSNVMGQPLAPKTILNRIQKELKG